MHNFKLSLVRKSIRIQRTIKHYLLNFINYKIANYKKQPEAIIEIGFIDNNHKIHVNRNYHHLFDKNNLYSSGNYKHKKENIISIVEFEGEPFIKKKFTGFFSIDKFYNEIICLDKLKHIKQTPNIKFIDYKNKVIYIEYIDGLNLIKVNLRKLRTHESSSVVEFKKTIELIHNHKIAIVDVGGQNMIIKDSVYYIIDFADSIYFSDKPMFKFCNAIFEYFALLDVKRFDIHFNNYF